MRFVNLGKGNTFFEAIESGYSCVRDASHWMPVPTDPYEAKDEVDEKNKAYPIGFHSKKESNEENFMMWQPIETAPTDDTPVDLWRDGVRLINMRLVNLGNGNTFFEAIESGYSCVRDASHWMPVPRDPYEAKDAVDEKNKAYPIGEDVLLAAAKVKFGDGVEIGAQSFVDSEVVRVGIALESGNISFGSNFYFKEGVFR